MKQTESDHRTKLRSNFDDLPMKCVYLQIFKEISSVRYQENNHLINNIPFNICEKVNIIYKEPLISKQLDINPF
jgi:hypothetical protein